MKIDTKIANVFIRFSGDLNDTFINRLLPYKAEIITDDFINVEYKVKKDIMLPQSYALIKKDNDRIWYYNNKGYYCYTDYNKEIDKYTMTTEIKGNHIKIETYSLTDEDEIQKINEALRAYKKTMPNPKESEASEDAVFEPDMPLINSTDQALRYAMIARNVFSIHSSAIIYNNAGIIFSAPSGTGKSTHTSLWKKHIDNVEIINDDSPFIGIEGDNIILHGSPWAGASGINKNMSAPLKAIVFLEQAKENSIEKLMTLPALQRLLKEMHLPNDKESIDRSYTFLNLLLSNVPCYILKCLPDKDAVLTVKKCIFSCEGE